MAYLEGWYVMPEARRTGIGTTRLELVEADPSLLNLTLRDDRQDASEPLNWEWKTPLASAITRKNPDTVQLLLELGASTSTGPLAGQSLIDFARENSTDEIVQILRSVTA